MKRTPLHTRLTLWLAMLLIVLGLLLAVSITRVAERYNAETTQQLNAGIAKYVTHELALVDESGVNRKAFADLAHRAMTVNPSAEVYLLGADGRLLATQIDQARIARRSIDLQPIREFLADSSKRPLYGDDPTAAHRRGVFSVAPVMHDRRLSGYLYVVLGSNKYESIAAAVRGNYSLQIALLIATAILVLALIVGAALFRKITLPLRRLAGAMQLWSNSMGIDSHTRVATADEIAVLNAQFALLTERIENQIAAIAKRDEQRRELIANVSHDLRTPLAALHGYLETVLLKGDQLSGNVRQEYLETAHRHSLQLERLIAALFELSKLESGATKTRFETFAIGELLLDVSLRFQLRARQLGVSLVADVDRNIAIVYADIALIERVLENLIDNALRHTPPGGRVILSTQGHVAHVAVAVVDTGSGIDARDLPYVFERLYRGGDHRRPSGTGLGLAIVKRIIELHGQRIEIKSTIDAGTRVEFGLPLPPVERLAHIAAADAA